MAYVEYSPHLPTRAYIERDRVTVLSVQMYAAGSLVTPTSGTVTIYNGANEAVVSAAAITTGSTSTYAVQTSSVASQVYGAGWRVEWSLVMPDTYTHLVRQSASLVRVRLACPVSDVDILAAHPELSSYYPSGQSSYSTQIGMVWEDAQGWLEGKGRRPYLVTDASALRPWLRAACLAVVCRMQAGDGDAANKWAQLADLYEARAIAERDNLTLEYDETDSGLVDPIRRAATRPTLWLGGSPRRPYPWRPV